MIVYEGAPGPTVRRGEVAPFPGARSRTRAVPYAGFDGDGADPWKARYRRERGVVPVAAGPRDVSAWAEALAAAPAGRVLVGTAAPAEPVYTASGAAVAAARALGRGVVLVEAPESETEAEPGPDLARVVVWSADPGFWEAFARRRSPAGVAVPLIPDWTASDEGVEAILASARAAGAAFLVSFELDAGDGATRAAIHADFAALRPDAADAFFDAIHHRPWTGAVRRGRERFRAGRLPWRVPAVAGTSDFAGNVRLVEAFESAADSEDEPLASRFLAAARRIEDLGRDVEDVARRGNLRLLWPADSPERQIAAGLFGVVSAT